jgi:hypothetical protein
LVRGYRAFMSIIAWTVLDAAHDEHLRAELHRRTAARPPGATRLTVEA